MGQNKEQGHYGKAKQHIEDGFDDDSSVSFFIMVSHRIPVGDFVAHKMTEKNQREANCGVSNFRGDGGSDDGVGTSSHKVAKSITQ